MNPVVWYRVGCRTVVKRLVSSVVIGFAGCNPAFASLRLRCNNYNLSRQFFVVQICLEEWQQGGTECEALRS